MSQPSVENVRSLIDAFAQIIVIVLVTGSGLYYLARAIYRDIRGDESGRRGK